MERRGSVRGRVCLVVGKTALFVLAAAAAFDGASRAVADGPESTAPPPGDPIEPGAWELHLPHTPYDDGPGTIAITELSPEEQAGIHAIGERSRYSDAVHGAWSAATHAIAADAEIQRAARRAGTTGLDTVGVEP